MKYLTIAFSISFILINAVHAQLNWQWAQKAGGTSQEGVSDICYDKAGNVYITGGFLSDTIFFGSQFLINTNTNPEGTFYLAKFDAMGNIIWSRGSGNSERGVGYRLAVDDSCNILVIGNFKGTQLTLDNNILINSNQSTSEIFIAKFDSSGNVTWSKKLGESHEEYASGICIDNLGNIYITGNFYSPSVTLDSIILYNTIGPFGPNDIFLAKLRNDGVVIWAKQFGGTVYDDSGGGVDVDNNFNLYLTGTFNSNIITFDNITLVNNNQPYYSIYLTKLDSAGNVIWAKSADADNYNLVRDIVVDDFGNSFITGLFSSSSIMFDSLNLLNSGINGIHDLFIFKFDNIGNVIWANSLSGYVNSSDVDSMGNIYIIGHNIDTGMAFGITNLSNSGMFVAKLDSSGNPIWATTSGTNGGSNSHGIKANVNGIYVTGLFSRPSIQFGSTILSNSSNLNDIYIAKLSELITFVNTFQKENKQLLFPNPTSEVFKINFGTNKIVEINVYDIAGKLIKQGLIDDEKEFDISELNPGIYFVKVTTDKQEFISKLIKQ